MTSNAKRTPPPSGMTTNRARPTKSVPPAGINGAGALSRSAWAGIGRVGHTSDFRAMPSTPTVPDPLAASRKAARRTGGTK